MASTLTKKRLRQAQRQTPRKRAAQRVGNMTVDELETMIQTLIDHRATSRPRPDPQAWERARGFMLALQAQGAIDRPRTWTREEIYEERMSRYARRSH